MEQAGQTTRQMQAWTARILKGPHAIEQIENEWSRLCDERLPLDPFSRPGWIRAHVKAFERDASLEIVVAYEGSRISAVLPLIYKRASYHGLPIRALKAPTSDHAFRFDMACDPSGPIEADAAIWDELEKLGPWDVVELANIHEGANVEGLIQTALERGYRVVQVRESDEVRMVLSKVRSDWRKTAISSGLRSRLSRAARILMRELGVAPQLYEYRRADPIALRQFYELEAAGWKGRGKSAVLCHRETKLFYDTLVTLAEEAGCLRLYHLRCGDRLIGAALNLQTGDCITGLKLCYEESLHRASPGLLLLEAMIDHWAQSGIGVVNFGPDAPYKRDWSKDSIRRNSYFIYNRNWYGNVLCSLKGKIVPLLKQLGGVRRSSEWLNAIELTPKM